MTTGLWAAISGMPAAAVVAAIPPACRRTLDDATAWTDGDDAIIEAPVWPAAGATHFVPSFSALTPEPFSVRLELSVRVGAAWSPWVAGVGLGPAPFAPLPDAPPLRVDVDVFRAAAPVEAVRLRARLRAPTTTAIVGAPWLLAVSAADGAAAPPSASAAGPARLAVRALSQMESDAAG